MQYTSPVIQNLSARANKPVDLSVGTQPGMLVSYNPSSQKARVTVLAKNAAKDGCISVQNRCVHVGKLKFFTPKDPNREHFWEDFKHSLASWRYNPLLAARAGWSYLSAWHERRTNLSPAEFLMLALELTQLEPSDFAVTFPPAKKRAARKEPAAVSVPEITDKAPLAVKDRPIVVEVLNASGKKGLALELTQYLREQNEKGQLRVDVLQYDNYPTRQEHSWLEDYSGRLVQVKQLGRAIGINAEIKTGSSPNVICDTRIILGADFRMPL